MTSNPRPATADRYVGRQHRAVVREHQAGYDTGDRDRRPPVHRADTAPDGASAHGPEGAALGSDRGVAQGAGGVGEGAPLGVAVLAEVPELAGPLEAFARADRLLVEMVLGLTRLLETDTTMETTGVGIEHWLALTADAPRLERRTWLRAARLLGRLPKLAGQVEAGRVSAGQLRGLTLALRGIPTAVDATLDDWLADAATELHRLAADPDALVEQARQALIELTDHTEALEHDTNRTRHLHLQPRLDGSGGTFHGEEDAYGFAILEAATRPRPDQHDLDLGRTRADNLQASLHHIPAACCRDTDTDEVCRCTPNSDGQTPDTNNTHEPGTETGDNSHRSWAHAIADAERTDAAYHQQLADLPDLAERIAGYAEAGGPAPPKLLLRAELSTLLQHDRIPATLLTTLTGGQLHLTSTAARALIDTHGTDLRLTIIDHGHVVGVGRATRQPPGWLTDTLHTIHDHCTGPFCNRPAHGADTDHAAPWHPDGDQPAGTTDLDNLGPLCTHTNRNRPATGWQPHQHDTTGTRTWTHHRTGLTTTTIPTTWRPPTRHTAAPGPPDSAAPPRDTGPPHGADPTQNTGPPHGTRPSTADPPDEPAAGGSWEPDDVPF